MQSTTCRCWHFPDHCVQPLTLGWLQQHDVAGMLTGGTLHHSCTACPLLARQSYTLRTGFPPPSLATPPPPPLTLVAPWPSCSVPGLQANRQLPGLPTIEGVLEEAILKAGMITVSHCDQFSCRVGLCAPCLFVCATIATAHRTGCTHRTAPGRGRR